MIKTLIADDEHHAIERLRDLLAEYDQFQIIAEAHDGTQALENIVALKPDVVFLDINMPGVSVFNTIGSLQDPPLVVFQTAHSKYAADAFDVNALDYLLKPISKERFSKAIEKILTKQVNPKTENTPVEPSGWDQSGKVSVKAHGSIKIVPIGEIRKICFEEGLSFIYTEAGRFVGDHTLNYYEEKLQEAGFFRTNRSNLVNLEYVTTLHKQFKGNYLAELTDGSRVELSRRKAQVLKKQLDF